MPISSSFESSILDFLNVTEIADGDNTARPSQAPGETLFLPSGATSIVDGAPVVALDDPLSIFLVDGTAQSTGNTPAVSVESILSLLNVFNGGRVVGEEDGATLSGDAGLIVNSGTIAGGFNDVRLLGDRGNLVNTGRIESDSRAVEIVGSDNGFLNTGLIRGTGDQRNGTVYADNEAEDIIIANAEGGIIDAGRGNDGAGISLELGDEVGEAVEVTLINEGRIVGRGDAEPGLNTRGDGVRLFSGVEGGGTLFEGTFLNSGDIISRDARGVEIRDGLGFIGDLINKGRIEGETDGLYFGNAAHDANVQNFGRITSDSRAVNIDGFGVTLSNFGRIVGSDDQRNGTVYADDVADNYTILNQERALIDAGRGNNGSGVSLQTGEVYGDTVKASLVNDGTIRGRGDAESGNTIGDGVRLFSSVENAIFNGDIVNNGRILASEDSAAAVGIRIEDGLTLVGEIVNTGEIRATEVAIDAQDTEAGIDILNSGSIFGDVRFGAGDDVYNGADGRVIGIVDGGAGADVLTGGVRDDLLAGGAGNDVLTGGRSSDTFIFAEIDSPSSDIITDFEDGRDVIDVSDFDFDGLADIQVSQVGQDTVLIFAEANAVRLQDVSVDQITADDFIF
ncbi:hypothetical protein [Actibacterium sp. 188UL27-1]|uniref:hypothetical protein n=1 Tax=Actibacterium sp. 188UL27-1 TaxID=2786961 RepID=UPI0019585F2A|nr:hypothetical protein [Actibacterium sp. 188UL27-1]MBM7066369.1 hypothetical protein [Actibacterium sp. 188UL27-1]